MLLQPFEDTRMSDEKIPMPASGQDSPKTRPDGVGDVDTHGRGGGGESGGGTYDNPHTGKEARGESGDFQGGQSVRGYFGPGQFDGEKADPAESGVVGQGGHPADADAEPDRSPGMTPEHKPRQVTAAGRTFEVVETNGVAEAEADGKVGTDAPYEAEQDCPGSG